MDLIDELKQLQQELVQLALEPERVAAWVQHLRDCGIDAELAWLPGNLLEAQKARHCCIGRIQLHGFPIDRVELIVRAPPPHTAHRGPVAREFRHEDRFCINLPEGCRPADMRARRKPDRKFWLGPRTGTYRWHGGALAQELASDGELNRVLDQESVDRIDVKHDRKAAGVYIARTYIGTRTHAERGRPRPGDASPEGAFGRLLDVAGVRGEIIRDYQLPSQALLQALAKIAGHIGRQAGGLGQLR